MLEFDAFVQMLGADAEQYTPDQLRQLHVDVLRLAEILLEVHRARRARQTPRSPPSLDVPVPYVTIDSVLTAPPDSSQNPAVQPE